MKTIQHLSALAVITIILGIVYEAVQQLNGSTALLRTIFLGWILSTVLVTANWLLHYYHCKYKTNDQIQDY